MNFIDVFVLVLFVWFGYKGFTKGLVVELASIVALVVGVYGGLKFSYIVSNLLVEDVEGKYLPIVSFTITFAIIVLIVFLIGKLLEKIINLAALKIANKLAGAAFGVLKVALALSVLITIVESYDRKLNLIPPDQKENSVCYKPMLNLAGVILPELEKNQLLQEVGNEFTKEQKSQAE